MNRTTLLTIVAATVVSHPTASAVRDASLEELERAGDILDPARNARGRGPSGAARIFAEGGLTEAQVGEPASFGRAVKYLGLAQTQAVTLAPDCGGVSPELGPCVTLAPAPGVTRFNQSDLARLELPANSTKSLICFTLTPFTQFEFSNETGAPQFPAVFNTFAVITLRNELLDDPTLINGLTGAPFAGQIVLGLGFYSEARSLAIDERENKRFWSTRSCIGGLVSTRSLVEDYGLSDALAEQFFKKPITLTFGSSGAARLVSFGYTFYGVRLFGD